MVAQLSVRHGREAVEFYKRAFGAEEVYRVGGTDEQPELVSELRLGKASFWVADEAPESSNFSPESLGDITRGSRSSVKLLLEVDDPVDVMSRAVAAGAVEVYPVADEHGWRLGRIEDPFGHHWEIGKPLVSWPPARAGLPERG